MRLELRTQWTAQLSRGPGAHHAVIGECEARFLLVGQLPRIAEGSDGVRVNA